jgi:ribonuclease HII
VSRATFHVGADENGLGPRLGPMVVTAVLAKIAPGAEGHALHDPASDLGKRLGDSKGLVAFGDAALAEAWTRALVARGAGKHREAPTPDALLDAVCLDTRTELEAPCPTHARAMCWSAEGDAFDAKSDDLTARAGRDLDTLASHGVEVLAVRSVIVCNKRLDEAARAGRSRFQVDLHAMERLVLALRALAGEEVTAVCGKVGGYGQYGKAFGPLAGRLFTVLEESRARSAYRFPGVGDLAFVVDADASHRFVGLASLVGKYVRELTMGRIVHHFRRRDASLPVVSGYHDPVTTRFVAATEARRREERIPDTCFQRAKRGA